LLSQLKVVDFDKETWTAINNRNTDSIAERITKFIDNPDAIVKRATVLLKSYQWSEIAAGLAVLTGRRSTEVIKTAQFEYKSKFSVVFTGALKRGNEPVECVFEIPTLCEASLVINAISSLREKLGEEVSQLSKRQVAARFGRAVATQCDRHFSELVPPRDGKDNLYSHLFRAVYAIIASYWYCPPTIPEMEYRAAIQGHYQILDEQNPDLRRSLAAGRHYFDYKIADGNGNIDGRLGIKLHLPDVQTIGQFKHTTLKTKQAVKPKPKIMTEQSNSPLSIPNFYRSRLEAICDRLGISQGDAIQALFTWTEMGLSLADSFGVEQPNPQDIFESVEQLKNQPNAFSSGNNTHSQDNIDHLCESVNLLTKTLSLSLHQQPSPQNGSAPNRKAKNSDIQVVKKIERFPNNRKKSDQTIEADKFVNQAIDAIIDFNNADGRPHIDKWRICRSALRKLTGKGDSVTSRVIESRQDDIDAHNSQHELSERHNAKGKNYPSIDSVFLDHGLSFRPDS